MSTAPELSTAEATRVAAFDAAPVPPEACRTCRGRIRETVGMVCQTCGTDYAPLPDARVETVARAILHAVLGDTDGGLVLEGDLPAGEIARLIVEYGAAAAIAALPPSPAEEALRALASLEPALRTLAAVAVGNDYDRGVAAGYLVVADNILDVLRAALASPAPAPQGEVPVATALAGRDRYAQCDDTCTVDCGACKGAGPR